MDLLAKLVNNPLSAPMFALVLDVSAFTIFDGGVLTANCGIAVPTTRHPHDRRNDTYRGLG